MRGDRERLRNEIARVPQRLTGFLIWESIILLAFVELVNTSIYLSEVLCILGLITSLIGIVNFSGSLRRIVALEERIKPGQIKRGSIWFITILLRGRGLGVTTSLIFFVFWVYAIEWSFFLSGN